MARSLLEQLSQIRSSRLYDDTVAGVYTSAVAEPTLSGSLQEDLNVVRTLMKSLKGSTNWYDDLAGINISTNASGIAANVIGISTNASGIATNTYDISVNAGDIITNASGIAANAYDISVNAGNISTNTYNIATNASGIATNAYDISVNANDIITNASGIAANAYDISVNAGNISTNTYDIATNASGIANLQDVVGTTGDASTLVYSSEHYVTSGTSLETAIGALDNALDLAAGDKYIEDVSGDIDKNTFHALPYGISYTPYAVAGQEGRNMDVYVNGQLLAADTGAAGTNADRDYGETTASGITFRFKVNSGSNITYIIRQ